MISGVSLLQTSAALQKTREIGLLLKSNIWDRFVAKAQRRALMWWKKRTVPPGLAARFTIAGARFYNFGRRGRKPSTLLPYYLDKNNLRPFILSAARVPKTSRNTGQVVTRLAFGGGTLNFMGNTGKPNMRAVTGWTRTTRTISENFNVASYTRTLRSGTVVKVNSYSMSRVRTVSKATQVRGGETHAAMFGNLSKDKPALEARVAIELRKIVEEDAFTKGGDIKTALLKGAA